jgi:hypothetical protein
MAGVGAADRRAPSRDRAAAITAVTTGVTIGVIAAAGDKPKR